MQEKDGKNVTIAEVCWNGGGYKFNDGDADVANCVVDLHTNQDFSCIDVQGSSCNNHPGTAVGNVRLLHGLDSKAHQTLPKDVGAVAKAAISKFKDLDHGWDLNTNFDMLPMKDNGEYYGWTVQVRGTGDLNC